MLESKLKGNNPCLFKEPHENIQAFREQNVESSFSLTFTTQIQMDEQ